MSDQMKPALTAEEWRRQRGGPYHAFLVNFGRCSCGVPRVVNLYDPSVEPKQSHKLAALALHGQPFGFTREDVDWLRGQIDSDTNPETAPVEFNAFAASLAARIEALLPPEDDK